jgi:putative selenium metabolism protein SsnA
MESQMKKILIENGIIITLEAENRVLTNHAILVEDGKISKIAPQKAFKNTKAQVLDAAGKIVMPGFINAHMHFYSSFARGLTKAPISRNFPEILSNLWWRLDRLLSLKDCYASTMVAGIDAIRQGTTTIIDHHASPHAITGSLKEIAKAVEKLGLRACLCYEVSDRDGEQIAQEGINENISFLEYCQKKNNNFLKGLFGLHASFTLEEHTLKTAVEKARKYDAGFHIHCAEDLVDQNITQAKTGKRVVSRLYDAGILGPQTICAHAVHLDGGEWNMLAHTQTPVVHNPQSNMNNAVGVMDFMKAKQKGVLVGLGTDAMTNNMREEVRTAVWLQKLHHHDPSVAFIEGVDLLLKNNQRIANIYFDRVGQLRENWAADIILVDYLPPTPLSADNFYGHLLFGITQGAIDTVMVGGRILLKNKKLLAVDEKRELQQSVRLAAKLWKKF